MRFSLLLLLAVLINTGCSSVKVSEAKYDVVEKEDKFEVRDYNSQIIAETTVDGTFEDAGDKAFQRLYDYISGNNLSNSKVAMTAPVVQEAADEKGEKISMTAPVAQRRLGDKWLIIFIMPDSYTMDTIPQPKDSRINLREIPPRRMCAVRYSGRWTEDNYLENKTELENWMKEKELKAIGEPIWARYNPPYTLWFLRRNEILITTKNGY
jgi:uncharacterized protein YceK